MQKGKKNDHKVTCKKKKFFWKEFWRKPVAQLYGLNGDVFAGFPFF